MSTTFCVWCETCQAEGPRIRRAPGGVGLQPHADTPSDAYALATVTQWSGFLISHEGHDLRLLTERARPPAPPTPVGADFQPVPTHLIPPDESSPRTRTLCCDRAVMMLDRGAHVTVHEHLATCPGNENPPETAPAG